jgi:hypothetical protein
MVSHMKTTVEIPDELLIAAKKHAAESRRPLRAVLEEALRLQLARKKPAAARTRHKGFRWVVAQGGLPPAVNVADRQSMHEWLRRPL